jgi:hypothetical protein
MNIYLDPMATSEDRFAAATLARRVKDQTGLSVKVGQTDSEAEPAIHLRRTGPVDSLPVPGEAAGPESRESYRIEINSSGVDVQGRSSASLYYAVQTLAQLLEGTGAATAFPYATIEDWPALPYRGMMIDMSEGPLPTEAEVKRQIDFFSRWKGNQYFFYNEDSIELNGFPLLNPGARFSQQQIRSIIAYAKDRHVDVVPCLELYGHQHDLFRLEKYSELADFPHGGEFDPSKPEVKNLITDWINQYIELFPSRFVHIGFDETWEIARAARKHGGIPPAQLFSTQMRLMVDHFQTKGKLVMAWGDIMVKFPSIIPQLPHGLVAVPWWYEPDPDPEYKHWLDPLAAHGVKTFVAPGVNMWTEVVPDFETSFRNIDTFIAAGKRTHTLGVINTFWTDDQQALRRMGWPGMAYGAAAAWQSSSQNAVQFFSAYAANSYLPSVAPHVASALFLLTSAETELQKVWGKDTIQGIWGNPFLPDVLAKLKAHRASLRQSRILAEEAEEQLLSAISAADDSSALNALLLGAQMLDYAGMKSLYAIELDELWQNQARAGGSDNELWQLMDVTFGDMHGRTHDLLDALSLLAPSYKKNWLAEYAPYRMETALGHWNLEIEYWLTIEQRYARFRASYRKGTNLPSLSSITRKEWVN